MQRQRPQWLCWTTLLVLGVYTGGLGPLLPRLAQRSTVALGDIGLVLTVAFGASILSTAVAGWAADRYGRRAPLVLGLMLEGCALLLLPLATAWLPLLLAAALLGLGDGAVVVGTHVLISDLYPQEQAAALNRLNIFFAVGAVVGPATVAMLRVADLSVLLLLPVCGAVQLALAVALTRAALPQHERRPRGTGHARPRLLTSPLLWTLAGGLMVYVGLEIGLGSWTFTYARQAAGLGDAAAALLSSGFWGALAVGRLVSSAMLRGVRPTTLMSGAAALSTAGAALLVWRGDSPVVLVAGVLLVGVSFGPMWPVTFAVAARAFPSAAGSATGLLGTVSAAGGVAIPWLQGRALAHAGPTIGIGVTFVGCLLLLFTTTAVRQLEGEPA